MWRALKTICSRPCRTRSGAAQIWIFLRLDALQDSLAKNAPRKGLRRAAPAPDELAFARLLSVHELKDVITTSAQVKLFWEICQIPDFRNLGQEAHARLLEEIYLRLVKNGALPPEYLDSNMARLDHRGRQRRNLVITA